MCESKKTLAQIAQSALDAANACNLQGVVNTFAKDLARLREIARIEGWSSTLAINTHPISVLYSQAIGNMTGSESASAYAEAYDSCKKIATEGD